MDQHIERAVWRLGNIPDSALVAHETLFANDTVVLDVETYELGCAKRGDDQVAFTREEIARVEDHVAGRDNRVPVIDRLLHSFLCCDAFANGVARVVDAVDDQGPAIVFAVFLDVDLVAVARAMLDCPELASGGIDRGALYVAVALAPDFGLRVSLADEGVTVGGRAIGLQLHDLADMRVEILRQLACFRFVAFAQREVDGTGGAPLDVGAIVRGGRPGCDLPEDGGTVLKLAAVGREPRHR